MCCCCLTDDGLGGWHVARNSSARQQSLSLNLPRYGHKWTSEKQQSTYRVFICCWMSRLVLSVVRWGLGSRGWTQTLFSSSYFLTRAKSRCVCVSRFSIHTMCTWQWQWRTTILAIIPFVTQPSVLLGHHRTTKVKQPLTVISHDQSKYCAHQHHMTLTLDIPAQPVLPLSTTVFGLFKSLVNNEVTELNCWGLACQSFEFNNWQLIYPITGNTYILN